MAPFRTVEQWLGFPIHTGQWLSIVPVLAGIFLIVLSLNSRTDRESPVLQPAQSA